MPYRSLNSEKILATIERLQLRIEDRFPGSSLSQVCVELGDVGRKMEAEADDLGQPIWWVWMLIGLSVGLGGFMFFWVGSVISFESLANESFSNVQGIEAALNTIIIAGLGFITISTLEARIKRSRAIKSLAPLRSITHVIDMHQLTKDPSAVTHGVDRTAHSPKHELTQSQLMRYLDYCSEMLALTGKLAALYAQSVDDPEVVSAVNDMEMLTTNLSRKIWQKIMMIET